MPCFYFPYFYYSVRFDTPHPKELSFQGIFTCRVIVELGKKMYNTSKDISQGDVVAMASTRSFREYVASRFYNNFIDAISTFIGDDIDGIGLHLSRVHTVGEWEIYGLDIKSISVNNLPGMEIQFDTIIDADFYVREADYHRDEDEETHQWFLVSCLGDLESFDNIQIIKTTVYGVKNKILAPMSDSLVPIISKDQLEDVATNFLRRNYPEALSTPMAVDPTMLAARMGLSVQVRQITTDFSVFGQIFFHDTTMEVYDSQAGRAEMAEVKGKTIVVDPQNFFLRNLGSVNNTIIHECVHWDLHRKAFQLEWLYNKNAAQIQCKVVGGIKDSTARSATDWMEWQANALAPKIQMPLIPFKRKAFELLNKYRIIMDTDERVDVLEPTIDELALFYGVSRLAAKIRMIDAGYEDAVGVFIYIDGHYVTPHRFRKNSIRRDQTFSISIRDAVVERVLSPKLRDKIDSGNYLFIDSHLCLNHSKYVRLGEDGKAELTKYARLHMDECCLIFDLTIDAKSSGSYGKQFFTECVLYRDASSNIIFIPHYSSSNKENPDHAKMLKDYNKDLLDISRKLPMSFSGMLDALIKWTGMKEEDLAEAAELSTRTIQRLRNNEPNNVTIETVMQLCIGMKLPPSLSYRLIQASGNSFLVNEQHIMYQFLLGSCYTNSVEDCNDKLIEQGLNPLCKIKTKKSSK